jgi:hypothetical protein
LIKEHFMKKSLLMLALLLAASMVFAQEEASAPSDEQVADDLPEFADAPEPPTLPPQVQSGEVLEPEVTIRESDEGTVEEYRMGGQLYMVKITPTTGPAYYLIDSDGDGEFVRQDDITESSVPQWVLFSW